MNPAPPAGSLYPQLNEKKRKLLEENGAEIARRLGALESTLINRRWTGVMSHTARRIQFSWLAWGPWAALFLLTPGLFLLGTEMGNHGIAAIIGMALALIAGIMLDPGMRIYRSEVEKWERKRDLIITCNASKLLWSSSYGHLPGMDDERASNLLMLINRAGIGVAAEAIQTLDTLRNQYDSDLLGARISSQNPLAFFHQDWIGEGEPRDAMGMTSLCLAVDNLDFEMFHSLVDKGCRMDVVSKPYGAATPVTLLRIAMSADGAAARLACETNLPIHVAKDRLADKKLTMFKTIVEKDPEFWLESRYNDYPLADHGASGNSRCLAAVEALRARGRLLKSAGHSTTSEDRRKM